MNQSWHALDINSVIKKQASSVEGLDSETVRRRLEEYGKNEIITKQKGAVFRVLLNQLKDPLIHLLIVAGVVSAVVNTEKPAEAIAIFSIVVINTLIGFFQEFKAEKSLQALSRLEPDKAVVRRAGKLKKVDTTQLVPGDIIVLAAGDSIPADARVVTSEEMKTTEASLTGESNPVLKTESSLAVNTVLAERTNMLFMGTVINEGTGTAVVVATGLETEFGKIATSLSEVKEERTPLQEKFAVLARQITFLAAFLVVLTFIIGYIEWSDSLGELLLFSLVLAVATVPSALPLIVTFSLSQGARRLAGVNMLLRSLPVAESMGSVDFICTDKTGTLTKNEMTATKIYASETLIDIKGTGYYINEQMTVTDKKIEKDIHLLCKIALNCNNSALEHKSDKIEVIGDPTEASLLVLAEKAGLTEKLSRVKEFPFDSNRKRMGVVTAEGEVLVKGSPESILELSSKIIDKGKTRKMTKEDRDRIKKMQHSMAKKALRVLAFAYREGTPSTMDEAEQDLIFVGLVGMQDPPRDEATQSIKECRDAGIDVMMITGDNLITAKAIAEQLALLEDHSLCLESTEVDSWSDDELDRQLGNIAVIARATPALKLRIVTRLQRLGHVVSMTGDGVNDAPALKKANVGLSMGITGSDVAKEASKGVLLDDNFSTIVNAIREGRGVYDKIIKSAKYLLSCNLGEIVSVLGSLVLFNQVPLLPLQILMINMLTDSAPAAGLGSEKNEDDAMSRPPRHPSENPINKRKLFTIVLFGLIMGGITVAMFGAHRTLGIETAQTIAFTTLVVMQLFAVISMRSFKPQLSNINLLENKTLLLGIAFSVTLQILAIFAPFMQSLLGTVALSVSQLLLILGVGVGSYALFEISKIFIPEYIEKPAK